MVTGSLLLYSAANGALDMDAMAPTPGRNFVERYEISKMFSSQNSHILFFGIN